MQSSFCIHS
ncbi:hypothetical protein Ccrd_022332 [Cynara cardunculus var. scolymus]|uniref:Uncharacterized protein n=1 Tax=Cynara cardunculus var. scolymus TaxID=59895 RepID=A0A103XYW5_CYNCS|nr:hypothetical protein Ccrd_022332 [Cynara cardunculus var. scolymus]